MRLPPALILLLGLLAAALAACDHVQPSPVGTNCVHQGRNRIPVRY